jgi:hypothetical protein
MKRKPPWRPGNASSRFLESSLADPKKSLSLEWLSCGAPMVAIPITMDQPGVTS